MTGTIEFDGITIGRGCAPRAALSVTDVLDPGSVVLRMERVLEITSGLDLFGCIRVKDDLHSPEAFAETVGIVASLWDRGVILESSDSASILMASSVLGDRRPLVCCPSEDGFDSILMAASMLDLPVVAACKDLERLLDLAPDHPPGVALDPMAGNMKGCLESNTDLHRLASLVPEADRPIVTRIWSGEYALSMASVSLLRYGDLVIVDDLDAESCMVLDRLASSVGHP